MRDVGSYLILTAVSPNLWDDYLVFYDSIRKLGFYSIAVVNLELTKQQSKILSRQNVLHISISAEDIQQFKEIGNHWHQWCKPFLISHCIKQYNPNYLLWLDVDLVVVDLLDELWEHMHDQFLVIQDYFAPLTCINDQRLYDKYPCPVDPGNKNATLNSGVLGFKLPRDNDILRAWIEKIKIIMQDEEIKPWVRLYDQGALFWALRDLKRLEIIQQNKRWNYPAKKNPLELHTASANPHGGDFQWPSPDNPHIGGDIHNNILLDHWHDKPIIVHFAGMPKLSNLCKINDNNSIEVFKQKRGDIGTRRIFCIGLERAGTHTFAEIIRRSASIECWVRHEHCPSLAEEAKLKFDNQDYKTQNFQHRMKIFKRNDCGIVCEANHRLGFFIQDIHEHIRGALFVLLLRNPIDIIRSRLLNFTTWPGHERKMPGFYQFDCVELFRRFGEGSEEQNLYRIRPTNFREMDPLDLHLWEVKETLKIILEQLRDIPDINYKILWIEDLKKQLPRLAKWIGNDRIDLKKLQHHANIRYGQQCIEIRPETREWIDQLVKQNTVKILSEISEILQEFDINTHILTMI